MSSKREKTITQAVLWLINSYDLTNCQLYFRKRKTENSAKSLMMFIAVNVAHEWSMSFDMIIDDSIESCIRFKNKICNFNAFGDENMLQRDSLFAINSGNLNALVYWSDHTYVRIVNFKPNLHRIDVKSDEPTLFALQGKILSSTSSAIMSQCTI